MTPTQRALADLKRLGFQAAILEKWNAYARVRQDVWGFADLLACREGCGIMLVQVTSGANHAARRAKILAEPRVRPWLESGGRVEVWSYRRAGAAGKRKVWTLRREEVVLADLPMEPDPEVLA
jgi:hypothetical protein